MAKRHAHRTGDWESVAVRLDEIISAHSGEDPFEEALTLLVARLAHEAAAPRRRWAGTAADIDALLDEARARWPGLLDAGVVTRLDDGELARCAAVLDGVRLLDDDLVGLDAIFEHLTTRVAKGQKGQFFTPRHVIREVVEMMAPAAGEHVVDPACGSGGFLCHALRRAPRCTAWGFDQDPRAIRVARVMLAASGARADHAVRADSLRRGELEERLAGVRGAPRGGFDLVLTNPPFAGDVGDAYARGYALGRGRGRRVERDVLFIERAVELLRPGGRYAIVLPHNKVGGAAWAFVRAWLLEHTRVVAVLGLGRNTFQPHTSQKACVVIGERRSGQRARPDEEIAFFISQRDGKDHRGRLRRDARGAVDCDLADATAEVRARLRGGSERNGLVVRTAGELGAALVLAPERFDPRRTVAVAGGRCLGDVVDIVADNVMAASFAPGDQVLILDTSHAWEGFILARHAPVAPAQLGSAKRALRPGDVIISRLRPYLRQVAFVDDGLFTRARGGNAVVASTEFYVLRGKDGLDAAALVPYLLGDTVQAALAAGQEGGHHPRFDRALLAGLPLPRSLAPGATGAAALAAEVRALAAGMRDTFDRGRALTADVDGKLRRAATPRTRSGAA